MTAPSNLPPTDPAALETLSSELGPNEPLTVRPRRSPAQRRRRRNLLLVVLRLVWGLALLGVLVSALWQPGDWPQKLTLWVLLTLLADEAGGWYGYAGVLLGALPLLSPAAPPEQWYTILPLVGGSLVAGLLVKHAGGILVLPLSFVLFALPILAAQRLGPSLDSSFTLPHNGTFERATLLIAAMALVFSLARQLLGLILRLRAEE